MATFVLFSYVILVLINLSLVTRLSKDKWRKKPFFIDESILVTKRIVSLSFDGSHIFNC